VIGTKYINIIQEVISQGEFPKGVIKGLITLVFKVSMREELGN
jgi:hypothetical protein